MKRVLLTVGFCGMLLARTARTQAQRDEALEGVDLKLIGGLLQEKTRESRARVLEGHPELLSQNTVFAVLRLGEKAVNAGEFDLALRACDAAEEIVARASLPPMTQGICGMMRGGLLGKMDRQDEAIAALQTARPLIRQGKNAAIEAMLVLDLGEQFEERGNVDEAKRHYLEAVELARQFKRAQKVEGEALKKLGSLEHHLGNLDEAEKLLTQALKIAQEQDDKTGEASTLMNLGFLRGDRGQDARALEYHRQALAIYREKNNRTGTIAALNACASTSKDLGHYKAAFDLYKEALERAVEVRQPSLIATIQDNLGTLLRLMGRWEEAVQLHEAALATNRQVKNPSGEALVLNHLGVVARVQGNCELAIERFDKALSIYQSLHSPGRISDVLVNKGNALSDLGRCDEALTCYRGSLALQRQLGNPKTIAAALMNLAIIQGKLGRREAVLACLEEARGKAREARDTVLEANAIAALAKELSKDGDLTKAIAMLEEALGLLPEGSPDRVPMLLDLAMQTLRNGQRRAAIQIGLRALEAARSSGGPVGQNLALMYLGMANLPQQNEPESASEDNPQAALGYLQEACKLSEDLGDLQTRWLAYYFCGKAYAALGDKQHKLESELAAIAALESQWSTIAGSEQRAAFGERGVRVYRRVALAYADAGDVANAFNYAERAKGRLLLEGTATRQVRVSAERLPPLLAQRQRESMAALSAADDLLRRELARPRSERDESLVAELRRKREECEDHLRSIKTELERTCPTYADLQFPKAVTLKEAQGQLPPGTALVEYIVEDNAATALLLTRQNAVIRRLRLGGEELRSRWDSLEAKVLGLRARPAAIVTVVREAHEFYQAILGPVLSEAGGPVTRLIVVPDGVLHRVPFALLVCRSPGTRASEPARYLCEDLTLSYAPSATLLIHLRAMQPTPDQQGLAKIVAFCDPAFEALSKSASQPVSGAVSRAGPPWQRLPATAEEGKAITELWGKEGRVYLRQEATEGQFKRVSPQGRFVHLATHGLLDNANPLYSAVLLAPEADTENGYLQAFEVCEMNLNANLVVLSACSTAKGPERDGEGLLGLARAFFLAGTPTVVATLWNVADEATSVLIREFYRQLKAGSPKDEALRAAQLSLLHPKRRSQIADQKPFSQPFYWAPFVLVGDWRS